MRSLMRALSRVALSVAVVFAFVVPFGPETALAQTVPTPAGQTITNTATATYTDANNTAYTTVSNTVTTTVQFAPSLTVTGSTAQNVAPNAIVTDSFTLKNTGNNAGTFTLPSDATISNGGTLIGYVIPGTTCTQANPCTLTQANTALSGLPATAAGGTLGIQVVYKAPPTVPASPIADQLTAQVVYNPATGPTSGLTAQTSASANATDTDTELADARLDLQKIATAPTSGTSNIVFTINGNNGGNFPAYGTFDALQLVNPGGTNAQAPAETKPGILLTDKIPVFPAGASVAANTVTVASATVNLAAGLPAGTSAKVLYTTDPAGATGWTETLPTGGHVAFVGVYIQSSTAPIAPAKAAPLLPSNPSGSAGGGTVTATPPQVQLVLNLTQPTGNGSANAGAISNIANSVIGGNPDSNGNEALLGPGIPAGTQDSSTAPTTTAITSATGPLQNTTPSTGTAAPGGASNTVTSNAFASQTVENGPVGSPAATGSYNGTAAITDANDFTAVGAVCTNNGTTGVLSLTAAANCTTGPVTVPLTFQNTGNSADNFTITVPTPPTGYTAAVFNATCPTGPYTVLPTCTQGPAITAPVNVASGASLNYEVVFTPVGGTNQTPFAANDAVVSVAGTGTNTTDTNTTHVEIVPGGPLKVQKVQTITANNCPGTPTSGIPASGVCPGGTIQYQLLYSVAGNAAQTVTVGSTTTPAGTEPAFALGGLEVNASTATPLTITEDGTGTFPNQTTNNWATYTFGVGGTGATDSLAKAVFTYYTGKVGTATTTTFASGTYPTVTSGPQSFQALFKSPLYPGASGTITFTVTVK